MTVNLCFEEAQWLPVGFSSVLTDPQMVPRSGVDRAMLVALGLGLGKVTSPRH